MLSIGVKRILQGYSMSQTIWTILTREAYRHRENVAFAVIVENSTTQFDVEETADDEQQRNEKHDNARYGERWTAGTVGPHKYTMTYLWQFTTLHEIGCSSSLCEI